MAGLLDFITGSGDYEDPNKIDPRYGVPMSDVRQAALNSIGNMGAILMAAGQRMEPAQRAAYLAQLGQAGSGFNTDLYNASQRRLMQARTQEQMQEMEENKRLDAMLKDPTQLQGLGVTQQQAQFLGRGGLRQLMANRAMQSPETAEARRIELEQLKSGAQLRGQLMQAIDADPKLNDQQRVLFKANPDLYAKRFSAPAWSPMSADDKVALGLKADTPAYMTPEGPKILSAGGTTINLGDTTDKLAVTDAMKRAQGDIAAGEAAASRINQSNTIRALLDQNVITGFGAEGRVLLGQAAQTLGFGVNDERLANSKALFSALAQRALDAAGQMKGQGQITEPERKLLADVAGSNVALGADAIRKVLDIADRVDQSDLKKGMRAVEIIRNIPGLKDNPLASVYSIEQPRSYQRTFNVEGKGAIQGRLGVDGKYYYTDPAGKRYLLEE